MIKKWGEKKKINSEKYKELEEDYRLNKMLEERQKSSNQRELESYLKEQHEAEIKKQLDIVRKKRTQDAWRSNTVLGKGSSILKDDNPILKQKNIFKGNKNIMLGKGKW